MANTLTAFMDSKQKKDIFEQAKKISSELIFWNLPEHKQNLNKADKKEVEYRLWENNVLDKLILQRLGDNGWNEYKEKKFKDEDWTILTEATQELTIFINMLNELRK